MKKTIKIIIMIAVLMIMMVTMFAMVTFAFNQFNQITSINQKNTIDITELSNSDTKDGITVSVESVHGGNNTVFMRLKIVSEGFIFNDDFDYYFGLSAINFKLNPDDSGKNLINGGGPSRNVDKELWTENVRYLDIERSVLYDTGVDFSLGDGQERVIRFEFFGYYDENSSWVEISDEQWRMKFSYYADDEDINMDFEPFVFYGKGLEGYDRLAQMTAIKLNKFSLECRYTVYEIREALDFTANLILKNGTEITLTKGSSACGINMEGFMIFKTESALDLNEVAHIQIGDKIIIVND